MASGTLILLCGLPGAGKTTKSKKLAKEVSGIVMSPDLEMHKRGISLLNEKARTEIETIQWQNALKLAKSGKNVIVENGFWSRRERDRLRKQAQSLGLRIELHFLDVPVEELWRRVEIRNSKLGVADIVISRDTLELAISQFEPPDASELRLFSK